MRLIDADALRESIINRQTEMSYEDAWALTCVDNAPTIELQESISASERMPGKNQKVLVDIIKTHKNMKNDWDSGIFLSPYAQFGCNVERILKNNDLID